MRRVARHSPLSPAVARPDGSPPRLREAQRRKSLSGCLRCRRRLRAPAPAPRSRAHPVAVIDKAGAATRRIPGTLHLLTFLLQSSRKSKQILQRSRCKTEHGRGGHDLSANALLSWVLLVDRADRRSWTSALRLCRCDRFQIVSARGPQDPQTGNRETLLEPAGRRAPQRPVERIPGLSSQEAGDRVERARAGRLRGRAKAGAIGLLLAQFRSPIVPLLILAAGYRSSP